MSIYSTLMSVLSQFVAVSLSLSILHHIFFSPVLTPVNEYNIVDKILSANNQLFASFDEDNGIDIASPMTTNKSDERLLQSKHRVTFSSDIEEYEDDVSEAECAVVEYKDDEAIDQEIVEIIERGEKSSMENDQIDEFLKRVSIEDVYSNDDDSISEDNDYTTELEVGEEINETIIGIQQIHEIQAMDGVTIETEIVNKLHVQIENAVNDEMEQNVEAEAKQEQEMITAPLIGNTNQINGNSLPCQACNKVKSSSARPAGQRINHKKSPLPNRARSASVIRNVPNKHNNPDDLLKIHLNVRACCENKYLDNNRLPRYNGYISQYGLSKDQLEMRELNRQKYQHSRARREREILRAKQEIANLNEQAFQQWLIRKNHLAKPKYKNMYDVVAPKPRIQYHSTKKFPKSNENSS